MLTSVLSIASTFAIAASLGAIVPTSAWAQSRKPAAASSKGRPATKAPSKTPPPLRPRPTRERWARGRRPLRPWASRLLRPSTAGTVETKTLDGGTQVFKFNELDIEGRLKSPQLVYFLRRVRAEFAAGDLGHRTFMREMSETRKESSF